MAHKIRLIKGKNRRKPSMRISLRRETNSLKRINERLLTLTTSKLLEIFFILN